MEENVDADCNEEMNTTITTQMFPRLVTKHMGEQTYISAGLLKLSLDRDHRCHIIMTSNTENILIWIETLVQLDSNKKNTSFENPELY